MSFEKTLIASFQKEIHLYHIIAEGTPSDRSLSKPSDRSESNFRLYSEEDILKMEKI